MSRSQAGQERQASQFAGALTLIELFEWTVTHPRTVGALLEEERESRELALRLLRGDPEQ